MNEQPILEVTGLSVGFTVEGSETVAVTDAISFSLDRGKCLALVGESGCGKSVTAMALCGLLPRPGGRILAGSIRLQGVEIANAESRVLAAIRGKQISFIFQEPGQALDPVMRIGAQMLECFPGQEPVSALHDCRQWLQAAGLSDPDRVLRSYPGELSGGMLQRVVICMALAPKPMVIVADEPTTALDVTVQAQVMEVLMDLCRKNGTALVLITHNIALVAQYADTMAVMYAGRVVERGLTQALLHSPRHPYTVGLMQALPQGKHSVEELCSIAGSVPRPQDFDQGCRFRNRCQYASELCLQQPAEIAGVACHHPLSGLPENRHGVQHG